MVARGEDNWDETMEELANIFSEFIGLAIFDGNERIARVGDFPAMRRIVHNEYISKSFAERKTVLSSSIPLNDATDGEHKIVFYLATPFPDRSGRVFVLTLPGTFLMNRLYDIEVWEEGYVFVNDRDGIIISNKRKEWVTSRQIFVELAETDPSYK
jgi:hypothetical protein